MRFRVFALVLACVVTAAAVPAAQVGKGLVDPNTAGEKDLAAVPHFNETIVKAVIGKRPFPHRRPGLAGFLHERPQAMDRRVPFMVAENFTLLDLTPI